MNERQLRALRYKHLYMLIRDLEEELEQAKNENAQMRLAYQSGLAQGQGRAHPVPQAPAQMVPARARPQQYNMRELFVQLKSG
ncbi:MAG: hypothetical protein FWF10_02730 [Clostridiales bacterium]|nr:hypothetical protein [Clostridiales bacterium]